jgi:L-iditol 2-dehydrogenase
MKAARFYEKHRLIVEDVPVRQPDDNGVLIGVRYCGVCGTDVHIFEGDKGSARVDPPVILGHELSGDVIKVGEKVKNVKIGDRVSVDPNLYCGKCYFCANGKKHLCEHMVGLGTAADGGFAEYVTVPEELVFPVADNVSYEAAAMTEPISCCLHGMNLTDVDIGDTVMIVGTGNIGMIMLQLAKHAGAAKIIAVEPNEKRREKAKCLGADICIDPLSDDTEAILGANGVKNIERVIDCAGLTSTAEYSVKYAGRGATVMLFGLTAPDDVMSLKPFELFQKELTIKGSFVNPDSFEKAGRLLETGAVKVDSLITDIVPLDDIQSVFENRLYAKDGKVLIKCFDK